MVHVCLRVLIFFSFFIGNFAVYAKFEKHLTSLVQKKKRLDPPSSSQRQATKKPALRTVIPPATRKAALRTVIPPATRKAAVRRVTSLATKKAARRRVTPVATKRAALRTVIPPATRKAAVRRVTSLATKKAARRRVPPLATQRAAPNTITLNNNIDLSKINKNSTSAPIKNVQAQVVAVTPKKAQEIKKDKGVNLATAQAQKKALEVEKKRIDEANRQIAIAAETERNRVAQEEAQRRAVEAEERRVEEENRQIAIAEETERNRVAQEEAQRRAVEAEERRVEEKNQKKAIETEKNEKIKEKIATNKNQQAYKDIGLTELFSKNYYGEGITVAVIEAGFYHTMAPEHRQNTNSIFITPNTYDGWYAEHKEQILSPLIFSNPFETALDQRFETSLGRGKDFRFRHGDRVFSQIAEAAPKAKVLPVMASFAADGSFVQALEALSNRNDINVINMSRWLEAAPQDETRLNPKVLDALRKCANKGKIIVLSAGNTSANIPTVPKQNQYDVANISLFCANLISDLFNQLAPDDCLRKHILISGALNNSTDCISNYSVTAGSGPASKNYITTKGTNYSSIFGHNWEGTSASAPYTSAVVANLLSAHKGTKGEKVVEALFNGAETRPLSPQIYGKGLINAKRALEKLEEI